MNVGAWPWPEIVAGGFALAVAVTNRSASKEAGKAAGDARKLGEFLQATTTKMQQISKEQSRNLGKALDVVQALARRDD